MKEIKIYLSEEDYKKLKLKAGTSRGSIQNYIRKIANEDICFLDSNVKALLQALNLGTVYTEVNK